MRLCAQLHQIGIVKVAFGTGILPKGLRFFIALGRAAVRRITGGAQGFVERFYGGPR